MDIELTPAEQAAAEALYRYFNGTDDGLSAEEVAEDVLKFAAQADAVVEAVSPIIAAEAVEAAANAWPPPWPIAGHDWLWERAQKMRAAKDGGTP